MKDRQTGKASLMDVHGAGSQRSDPKSGDPSRFPEGRGPQGDVIRIYNQVLCVRGGTAVPVTSGPKVEMRSRGGRSDEKPFDKTQGRQGEGGGSKFMQKVDRNGDGKVGKDEFRGPPDHFDRFDKNKDGYITEDEAPTGPPGQKGGSSKGGRRR